MSERMFGTNGIRGIANEYLTPELALQLGKSIGAFMKGRIAIATDTRVSAEMIKSAVSAGIRSVGYDVLDLGVVPTPALQYYVKQHDSIYGGVMIAASHNPPEYNGIKCISDDGTELLRMDESKIEDNFASNIPEVPWECVGKVINIIGAEEEYVDGIIEQVDYEAIRNAGLYVCLDCANGASFKTSPMLLKKLKVRAVTMNCDPQGEFPGHLSEPTEENLKDIMALTKSTKADLGIAHDCDADRCIFISSAGKYVDGDKTMAIMSKYYLSSKKGTIVATVSASSLIEDVVKDQGGNIVYTSVGSPALVRRMEETNAILGGEENGGIVFPEFQYCRDGAMALAKMLEFIVKNGPLAMHVSKLPEYYSQKRKLFCPQEMKKKVADHLATLITDEKVDNTDGLKIFFSDGWVLLRASGTEPAFRVFSESKDRDLAIYRADMYERSIVEFIDPNAAIAMKNTNRRKTKKTKAQDSAF